MVAWCSRQVDHEVNVKLGEKASVMSAFLLSNKKSPCGDFFVLSDPDDRCFEHLLAWIDQLRKVYLENDKD